MSRILNANYIWYDASDFSEKDLAMKEFEELKKTHDVLFLICSNHWATEGYWIEFKEPKNLSDLDFIMDSYIKKGKK